MAGQIGYREPVGAIAGTCGVSGGQRPFTARKCAARPVTKPVFHTPLLGRPSGRTEGAIRLRPGDLGVGHARYRDFGHSCITEVILKWPWCANQRGVGCLAWRQNA